MRLSARLLLSLAFLAPAPAFDVSAAEPVRCESPPTHASNAVARDPAEVENARGNQLARAGDAAAARTAHQEAERLARARGNRELALRAAANAARDAIDSGRSEGVRVQLVALRGEAESLPVGDSQTALLLHLGRSLALLAKSDPGAVADAIATLRGRRGTRCRRRAPVLLRAGLAGELYERGQRRADALDLTRRALFAAQSADAIDALYRWQWQLGRLRRAEGDGDGALREYRAAALTLARMRAEGNAPLAGDQSFATDVEPLYDQLVDLLLYRAAAAEDAAAKQTLLAEARDTIEDQKVPSCATASATIASTPSAAPRRSPCPERSSSIRSCCPTAWSSSSAVRAGSRAFRFPSGANACRRRLRTGLEYEWSVTLASDPARRSSDRVTVGWIERVEPPTGVSPTDPAALATAGLWYDAFAAAPPALRQTLLRDAGLSASATGAP